MKEVLWEGRFVEEDVSYKMTFCIGGRFVEGRLVEGRFVLAPIHRLHKNVTYNNCMLSDTFKASY